MSLKKPYDTQDQKKQRLIYYLNSLEKNFIDDADFTQYHERIYRINKALMSIQQNSNFFVRDFSLNPKKDVDISFASPFEKQKNENLDEILDILENQFNFSSEKEQKSQNAKTPIKDKETKRRMSKLFLKIELKLKSILEEEKVDKCSSSSKSQVSYQQMDLPRLMRNFFDDKDTIKEEILLSKNKRKSVFANRMGRVSLKSEKSPVKKHYSLSEKQEYKAREGEKEVSNFEAGDDNPEDDEDTLNQNDSHLYFQQFKRNSILKAQINEISEDEDE